MENAAQNNRNGGNENVQEIGSLKHREIRSLIAFNLILLNYRPVFTPAMYVTCEQKDGLVYCAYMCALSVTRADSFQLGSSV